MNLDTRKFFTERFKRSPESDEYYYQEWVERIIGARTPEDLRGIADSQSMRIIKRLYNNSLRAVRVSGHMRKGRSVRSYRRGK